MNKENLESFLKRIKFEKNGENYVGYEKGTGDSSPITIKLIGDFIFAIKREKTLFQVQNTMTLGGLLALCQEFRLVHERYIYERLDGIEEYFYDSEE